MSAPDRNPGAEIQPSDPLAINFTSGTTGPSKGVLASHAHVITFARDWIRATEFGERQSIYTCMPLFHAVASWLGVVPVIINGGRISIAPRFSASGFWDDVRRARADVAHGIFSMVPIRRRAPTMPISQPVAFISPRSTKPSSGGSTAASSRSMGRQRPASSP